MQQTIDRLTEINGLAARLLRLRATNTGYVRDEIKLEVFGIERRLQELGVDLGRTQWEPPPEPTGPQTAVARAA
jgi:hypothetical protein